MNGQVARFVLVGEVVLLSLSGGCGELTALNASTVTAQDLPGEPLAVAVEAAVTLPSAPSRMQERAFPHEYQFAWGQSDRGKAASRPGEPNPGMEKRIQACLGKALNGARKLAFREPAQKPPGSQSVHRIQVVVKYAYVFLDHNEHRELGIRNWAGCEVEYQAKLLAPGGRELASYEHLAAAHRFSLFGQLLAEECLGRASRQAAADIVRWARSVLAKDAAGPDG